VASVLKRQSIGQIEVQGGYPYRRHAFLLLAQEAVVLVEVGPSLGTHHHLVFGKQQSRRQIIQKKKAKTKKKKEGAHANLSGFAVMFGLEGLDELRAHRHRLTV